jgi:hypothetical protein
MAAILALTSLDAEAINDHRLSHGLPPIGTTVADILPVKQLDIERNPERWRPVELSMRMHGLTAPIGVCNGYLTNGMHRVALAVRAGWEGMIVTSDFESTTDAAWDAANPNITWA